MTREEARAEAKRRWGDDGDAQIVKALWAGLDYDTLTAFEAYEGGLCAVGNRQAIRLMHIRGTGATWEAAFADATRRSGAEESTATPRDVARKEGGAR